MKVSIIVDHPDRDLDGLLILKKKLENKNVNVSLIPYYFLYKVFFERPDLVIFPHYRSAFYGFIYLIKKSKIMIAILDTEGGFFPNKAGFSYYINRVCKSLRKVDLYFLWGPIHYNAIIKKLKKYRKNFYLTGNPRFDLLSKKYSKIISRPNFFPRNKKNILFNSNFSEISPKFQTIEKETENSVKFDKVSLEFITQEQKLRLKQKNKFINIIKLISRIFYDCNIIIRPHPFEDEKDYKKIEGNNIYINNKGSIVNFLKYSDVIIQHNCHSAFESFILNNCSLNLNLLNNTKLKPETSIHDRISIQNHNEQQLIENIKLKLETKNYSGNVNLKIARKVIKNFFYKKDGNNSERISRIIFKKLKNRFCVSKTKIYYSFYPCNFSNIIALILKTVFRQKIYLTLKSLIKKRNYKDKFLDEIYIKSFLRKL